MPMHDLDCDHRSPKYTRQDYVLVAKVMRDLWLSAANEAEKRAVLDTAADMSKMFLRDNHLFNRDRFFLAILEGKLRAR